MQYMNYITKHKVVLSSIIIILVALIIYIATRGGNNSDFETQIIERTTVRQIVEETGKVQSAQDALLSFEQSGTVNDIRVERGDRVFRGDVLITLDNSEQYTNLLSARARLETEEAVLSNLKRNQIGGANETSQLGAIQTQQDVLIRNAYTTLLNNDLRAYPQNNPGDEDAAAPTISGTYTSLEEGVYIIETYGSAADSGASFILNGLENGKEAVGTVNATPLGTRGLYITFPDVDERFLKNREWIVEIPNKRSTTYNTVLNNYESAQNTKDVTIAGVESTPENIAAQESRVAQARIAVQAAEIQMSKRTLRAPFGGVVSDISISRGEIVTPSVPIVTLLSDDAYEIVVAIPESDIANVSVGDRASVSFDAYDREQFGAEVTFINPSATVVDNVPTIETTLKFDAQDERIRSGLSADVEILTLLLDDVFALPSRAIVERSQTEAFVRVIEGGQVREVPVELGVRGDGGLVEIISGLSEGDEVITFASEEFLATVE